MGIQSLDSLLVAGEFIGKTSKSGLNCLKNVFGDGKTVFTMLDKDMNIVKQSVKTPFANVNGFSMTRYLSNGERSIKHQHLESTNGKQNFITSFAEFFGGPKHSAVLKRTRADVAWSNDAVQNPYMSVVSAEQAAGMSAPVAKFYKKNLFSGEIKKATISPYEIWKYTACGRIERPHSVSEKEYLLTHMN